MTSKQKKMLVRIILAAVLLAALSMAPVTGWLRLALYLVPYLLVGYDILRKARLHWQSMKMVSIWK